MPFMFKHGSDGSRRLIDKVSGNTAQIFYPTNSSTGGRHKILTAAYTVTQDENGSVYWLNATSEFATTLPAPFLGAEYTFIVKGAPSGASYTVVTGSSANIIKGMQNPAAAAAGDTGTADDTISFVDGQAVAGDMVQLWSDGTSWFAQAFSRVAAGITFTQAST
jgi:hypothetical protein